MEPGDWTGQRSLVIVESPAKARKIQAYLGDDFTVLRTLQAPARSHCITHGMSSGANLKHSPGTAQLLVLCYGLHDAEHNPRCIWPLACCASCDVSTSVPFTSTSALHLAQVLASYGHIRDLAQKPGSVKPEKDFELVWSTQRFAAQGFAEIKCAPGPAAGWMMLTCWPHYSAAQTAPLYVLMHRDDCNSRHACRAAARKNKFGRLVLATDPDREGEAISWHVLQELQVKIIIY